VYLKNVESAPIPKIKTETIKVQEVNPVSNAGLLMHL
jgi:hypothetical protein